jgi:two-component system, NarL family, invasion response regulator UvrY
MSDLPIPQDQMAKPIRVLVADDHAFLTSGVVNELKKDGMECVAELTSVVDLIAEYERTKPDVLVLDIFYGDGVTGFDALGELLKHHPDAKAVFLSQYDDDEQISRAYHVGALSFVPKRKRSTSILAEAIRQVHAGNTHLLPEIADRLARLSLKGISSPLDLLTEREMKVFEMMARGLTNEEMAKEIGITPRMVSINSQSVKSKLGVERSAEITLLAVKHKVIQP